LIKKTEERRSRTHCQDVIAAVWTKRKESKELNGSIQRGSHQRKENRIPIGGAYLRKGHLEVGTSMVNH